MPPTGIGKQPLGNASGSERSVFRVGKRARPFGVRARGDYECFSILIADDHRSSGVVSAPCSKITRVGGGVARPSRPRRGRKTRELRPDLVLIDVGMPN